MWEHLEKDGVPHEMVQSPKPAKDLKQFWFDPKWRAQYLHWQLSKSSFKADILPVANTHLGPGSLAACLGAELEAGKDTIWIKENPSFNENIFLDENNHWWQLHLHLLQESKKLSQGKYFVGCPDLIEGLDTLASLKGTDNVLMDMLMQPEILEEQLLQINNIYFDVFNRIYEIIREGDEMAFCYFSLWAPGKVSKLQSDISLMISEDDFRRFAQPYLREQAQKIDFTLYHLDGVDAIRHLDAEGFICFLKEKFPELSKIVVGYDFHFGKDRKYSFGDLKTLFEGKVVVVEEVSYKGDSIHSHKIRAKLKIGDIKGANNFLGHNYTLRGAKVQGQGIGAKELVATINIEPVGFLIPKEGVYATLTRVDKEEHYHPSVSFIGHRVSTDGSFAIESHILDGKVICTSNAAISFVSFIRNNKKFDSIDELKKAINADIAVASRELKLLQL